MDGPPTSTPVAKLSIEDLRERAARGELTDETMVRRLKRDRRKGVKSIARTLDRQLARARAETERMQRLLTVERAIWATGIARIAGVDEVGMGPLAGPVVAGAVILPAGHVIDGVDDSKRLDAETRSRLDREIRAAALAVGIGVASVEEIERINIRNAAMLAMRRALESLDPAPERVLLDARELEGMPWPQEGIIKGDASVHCIAAASVVAKVYRDALMVSLDHEHPGYGFARHKGYGTPAHLEALDRLGPCPIHRSTFHWAGRQLSLFGTTE